MLPGSSCMLSSPDLTRRGTTDGVEGECAFYGELYKGIAKAIAGGQEGSAAGPWGRRSRKGRYSFHTDGF